MSIEGFMEEGLMREGVKVAINATPGDVYEISPEPSGRDSLTAL